MTPTTIDELLDYWPGNIPFKGQLVSDDGSCMCAQGQALHFLDGLTVDELRNIDQAIADKRVAKIFDISLAHSILLRIVNDRREGAPSSVIRNPEKVLGNQAQVVLAFWRHLDCMTPAAWKKVTQAARKASGEGVMQTLVAAARDAAMGAACEAFGEAAAIAARGAVCEAFGEAAASEAFGEAATIAAGFATNEIQGASVMRANNQPFFFLPLFGFRDPEAVIHPVAPMAMATAMASPV